MANGIDLIDGGGATPAPLLGVRASATGRVWQARLDARQENEARAIAQQHGLPEIVGRVLAGRGVDTDGTAAFLDPSLKALLPDPSTLTDCEAAAERIADAVIRGERVTVFADYDVDGATSAALMVRALRAFGLDPRIYVPDRVTEGYGPSVDAVRRLCADADLLIAVDCGSAAHDPLDEARKAGVEVVVIDHHPVGETLAPARAIVNPNRQDDLSGQGILAAAGVTFVVLVALNRAVRRRGGAAAARCPDLLGLLDLVALGTVCDVVPLAGLNRAFVVKGLKLMRSRVNPGLTALCDCARLSAPPAAYHLGFLLGPRINAGGRIGDAGLGARLLTTDDPAEAGRIAVELDRLNRERQTLETAALKEAEAMLLPQELEGGLPPVVCVSAPGWHVGVVGLVASRLKERHRRPALAIAFDEAGIGVGSARSVPGVDLGAAIRAAAEEGLLIKGGGHAMAAGFTVAQDRLEALNAFLCERLGDDVLAARASDGLAIDGVLFAGGANESLVGLLERAGPFGAKHPEPTFAFANLLVDTVTEVGETHFRVGLKAEDGAKLDAMAFRARGTALGNRLVAAKGGPVHVAGGLMLDTFRGIPKVRLKLSDVSA